MTPERVMQIAESVEFQWHWSDEIDRESTLWYIERAITLAVNEALSEIEEIAKSNHEWVISVDEIRAMKLKEE